MSLIVGVRFLVILPRDKQRERKKKWIRKFACQLVTVVGSVRLRGVIEIMRPVVDTCLRWWYLPSLRAPHRLSCSLNGGQRRKCMPFLNKGTPFVYVRLHATDISCLHKGTSGISELTLAGEFRSLVYCLLDRGDKRRKILHRVISMPRHV